ncbi:MAG: hypothetical protein ABL871_12650 [Terricaulis sp.]
MDALRNPPSYLEDGPRIRDQDGVATFTYKRMVASARELVEIETEISREDFDMLWPECVTGLHKTRYAKRDDAGDWVVDFLRDGAGALYFVLAEVELPRGVEAPSVIAPEIAPFVVHAVAATDSRFTNKRLTDVAYASELYREITGG